MLLCNFLEHINYSILSGSLWNYYWYEFNDSANENNTAGNYRINNNKTITSKSFEYKTKIGNIPVDNNTLEIHSIEIIE